MGRSEPSVARSRSEMSSFDATKADAAALLQSGDVRGAIAKYEAALSVAPDAAQRGAIHSNLSLLSLESE